MIRKHYLPGQDFVAFLLNHKSFCGIVISLPILDGAHRGEEGFPDSRTCLGFRNTLPGSILGCSADSV